MGSHCGIGSGGVSLVFSMIDCIGGFSPLVCQQLGEVSSVPSSPQDRPVRCRVADADAHQNDAHARADRRSRVETGDSRGPATPDPLPRFFQGPQGARSPGARLRRSGLRLGQREQLCGGYVSSHGRLEVSPFPGSPRRVPSLALRLLSGGATLRGAAGDALCGTTSDRDWI